jgi:hypothetical protein
MKKPRCLTAFFLAVALMLLFIPAAPGQDYRGRIEGLVTDQTKAIIPGANVTLLNVKTGVKVVRQTSDTGLYLFDLIDPGTYTVTIEARGFGNYVQQNVVVEMKADITVNASLKPGTVQESVTVSEAPNEVQFNTGSHSRFHDVIGNAPV